MNYILQHQTGIYYIMINNYLSCAIFKSKEASRYIAAIELLAEYRIPRKFTFVLEWLNNNKESEGYWDMGSTVKDGVRFPLSDSWRKKELRVKDCTYRISKLIENIEIG